MVSKNKKEVCGLERSKIALDLGWRCERLLIPPTLYMSCYLCRSLDKIQWHSTNHNSLYKKSYTLPQSAKTQLAPIFVIHKHNPSLQPHFVFANTSQDSRRRAIPKPLPSLLPFRSSVCITGTAFDMISIQCLRPPPVYVCPTASSAPGSPDTTTSSYSTGAQLDAES